MTGFSRTRRVLLISVRSFTTDCSDRQPSRTPSGLKKEGDMADNSALQGLTDVTQRIAAAEREADRDPGSVTLVAVSKTFDAAVIRSVLQAGHRTFGENRVQEAQGKWPALRDEFSGIDLHLIGPLQSNKTKDAVALFDVIESVDRDKIAAALAAETKRQKSPRRTRRISFSAAVTRTVCSSSV
jgi:uncharacterized pyridoxal phosphate-containing UPF0001 family protein